jgi:hypothetical protein
VVEFQLPRLYDVNLKNRIVRVYGGWVEAKEYMGIWFLAPVQWNRNGMDEAKPDRFCPGGRLQFLCPLTVRRTFLTVATLTLPWPFWIGKSKSSSLSQDYLDICILEVEASYGGLANEAKNALPQNLWLGRSEEAADHEDEGG